MNKQLIVQFRNRSKVRNGSERVRLSSKRRREYSLVMRQVVALLKEQSHVMVRLLVSSWLREVPVHGSPLIFQEFGGVCMSHCSKIEFNALTASKFKKRQNVSCVFQVLEAAELI
ncbi:hypothetical protein SLEP1_g51496 [Rubroshorea leprosula]|uniref:Uncharacterized protein n=1 Tax=Rubroshorea leprosula TaxID=152421 RepID=A0AAV5M5K2_9ROSI|nr:hypothetical protein SLEP1_g51496 [Rubroshorea leprosula]